MPITKPAVDADTYLAPDSETIQPKVGTTVQEGWDAVEALSNTDSEFPTDFRFSDEPQLIKFLQDRPFATYEQHWIERPKGKKSFVCLGDTCPLCDVLGDKPRGKFAFNVLVLIGETTGVQVLTAPPSLARQIKKAHDDERKGPLDREFWEISRMGTGPTTQYTLNFVRGRDLAEEWKLNLETVTEQIKSAEPFTAEEVVRETPRSELLEIARSIA
ncbi:hypothetical protein UFOVP964_52 [uncultured Caudovirales phage]|uniref:Uncharacterized protein n=1 Tax=uncultured Caudovirales phage TaxID=2100421 RepID=A0A6J5QX25_9CAUD|nr:hypothetical protein UFOVP854_52 [uncultured Caudovirales phage]CAB4174471.1 hypothetical protein UFOVP964_52 [uncultured Caudovirales phage]CAB4179435.1 hypothetical protein UFOVP1034_106 [uncultured Caudovirales phage]CAB4189150.1 hypothetical protein UFOVP1177_106 [uncultured Caudovirales phage]CAB4193506.1 hypothetical protein UFOVP1243_93 [uncultured Caudovirales phage]